VGGPVFSNNFIGDADNFKIGIKGVTTTYDFEFTIANAGEDKIINGHGSNSSTLSGKASGGVGPYTYSWSDGKTVWNQKDIKIRPSQTTTYTLTVTDANGCSGTDEVVVTVK
jgi:hypothetical protein